MSKLLIYGSLFVLLIIGLLGFSKYEDNKKVEDDVKDFESCVKAGNAILESYPERCVTKDGKSFTRDIGNELEKIDLIRLESPRPGDKVESPLVLSGEARGYWFFEASFPVRLIDENGNELVSYYATAKSEWMTENFVPFETKLVFNKPETSKGKLILQKDNPSGLPEHDDFLEIPVRF